MLLSTRGRERGNGLLEVGHFWSEKAVCRNKTERDAGLKHGWMNVKEKECELAEAWLISCLCIWKYKTSFVFWRRGRGKQWVQIKQLAIYFMSIHSCTQQCLCTIIFSVFLLLTMLFSAIYALVSSYTTLPTLPGGLLNVSCPFLKCCTVLSTYTSFSLWFALLIFAPSFLTFNPEHKTTSSFLGFPLQGL